MPLRLILILGLLSGLGPFCTDLYLPALPSIQKAFNQDYYILGIHFSSASLVNLTLAGSMFGIAWGQILIGYLSDRYGRKNVLLISLFFFVLSSYLCSVSNHIFELILWRFLQGVSAAAGVVISRAMGYDLFKGESLLRFTAMLMLVFGLAPILSPLFGAFLLEFITAEWQSLFVTLAILGLLLGLSSWFFLTETLPASSRNKGSFKEVLNNFKSLLTNQQFTLYLFINSFAFGSLFAYISASSFVFQNIYHLDKTQYSYLFAFNALGVMIVASSVAKLATYFQAKNILKYGIYATLLGSIGVLFALFFTPNSLLLLEIPLFFVVSGFGAISSTSLAEGMNAISGNAGVASGLFGVVSFTLAGLIAPLVGVAGESNALPMGILFLLCNTIAAMLFFVAQRKI
ncbi:hypothetical protein CCZ01_06740 [Helicobacter monodelphidis]|uniref:multidrug effflux MFS transporter n=1 Tax=Helicobacter sp. 15-1451 TaxID=2004995 RepID=UPI000DCF0051|nr:multidrug effflux MFS transporter [Helicobacter sp. 15-1451]RAX57268.1 hypothetical protein CCZ01_06740 [Helicobacter sp. 15-1451]